MSKLSNKTLRRTKMSCWSWKHNLPHWRWFYNNMRTSHSMHRHSPFFNCKWFKYLWLNLNILFSFKIFWMLALNHLLQMWMFRITSRWQVHCYSGLSASTSRSLFNNSIHIYDDETISRIYQRHCLLQFTKIECDGKIDVKRWRKAKTIMCDILNIFITLIKFLIFHWTF